MFSVIVTEWNGVKDRILQSEWCVVTLKISITLHPYSLAECRMHSLIYIRRYFE